MSTELAGKKVAILVADGFEQVELTGPRDALIGAGAQTFIVSPNPLEVQGMNHLEKGDVFSVDHSLEMAQAKEYDALFIPGGLANPDVLRSTPEAIEFAQHFLDWDKPIAAICHGPWVLIDAGGVAGKRLTSWPAIQTDVRNAGGEWVDQEVVVDEHLVTSRSPKDIPAFNKKMIEEFAKQVPELSA
ncbi:MAG: pfpI, protease [Verrucomicrobiaceae bacterium]|nr:pfpI, protease [Verrucomicrobiaceae bacterium]